MSDVNPLGFGWSSPAAAPDGQNSELVVVQRPLKRVLAFTRRTIDDVVNDPIARNEVFGYYKLYRWVQRGCEIRDLERQWNSI